MPENKPNILFILTSDHGAWSLGCYGNHEAITPNIDKLAREGMRFDSFFCTSPVSSPARASMLTGKMPSQHGIIDWIKGGNYGDDAIEYLQSQTGFTRLLSGMGYRLGLSGKWHLGDSGRSQQGFSHWFAHKSGSGRYYSSPMIKDGKLYEETGYITDVITDDAIGFMDECAKDGTPFFMSVNYTAPHDPWYREEHPRELFDLFAGCTFESCPQHFAHPDACYIYDKADSREALNGYFAAVTGVDRGVGRLVQHLERLGLAKNTLVIFTADNGFNCGHHGLWGKGNANFSFNMFDTLIKVPFIACHKGKIPEGAVCHALLSQYDLPHTLLEYCGTAFAGTGSLPGSSFYKLLCGSQAETNEAVYLEYGPVRAIRTTRFKYVHRYPYGPHELYDLVNDPGETVNLIGNPKYAQTVPELKHALEKWFLKYTDSRVDAAREPVRGNGQLTRAGIYAEGKNAFDQNRVTQYSVIPAHVRDGK